MSAFVALAVAGLYMTGVGAFAILTVYLNAREGLAPARPTLGDVLFCAAWPAILLAGTISVAIGAARHAGARARAAELMRRARLNPGQEKAP